MTHQLVGQKFNLIVTPMSREFLGETLEFKTYELNSEDEKKIREVVGEEARIFPPGTAGTMDYKPYRTNVYLNEEGVVYEVSKG